MKRITLIFFLAVFNPLLMATPIDTDSKYAWSETSGWLNHRSTHAQAHVYTDHLEGYVWGAQIGWIKLGSYSGGGSHTYGNTSSSDWGVNHDGSGNLSGYAWSETVGWINFNPSQSQVTIDLSTGDFDGYAWGSKIGWIHFKGNSYKVMLFIDSDGDGLADKTDNCPSIANEDQADNDSDNLGNACDPDPNKTDADDDGLSDFDEVRVHFTDPTNSDTDNDGLNDAVEINNGTNPLISDNRAPIIDATLTASQMQKLLANDGAEDDLFGYSVALDGDLALVGAHLDDDQGIDSGAAYLFQRQSDGSWAQQAKLMASDGEASDYFGWSVALDDDLALVGAYLDDANGASSGAAYLFRRQVNDTWTEEGKLLASDGANGDLFGYSVALDNDLAMVGAVLDDDNGASSGSAYLFRRQASGTWTEEAKFTTSDAAGGDQFGHSVALDGDLALVGAHYNDDNGTSSGSAYLFRHQANGTWTEEVKLLASDGAGGDQLGYSVALDDNLALVGANRANSYKGAAYLFRRQANGNWAEEAKLTASDGAETDYFGFSVALDDDLALVGAFLDDDKGTDSGSAYLFRRKVNGTWAQEAKLVANDGVLLDHFGRSVALSDTMALVGTANEEDQENGVPDDNGPGSAYLFTLTQNLSLTEGTNTVTQVNAIDPDTDALGYAIDGGVDQQYFAIDSLGNLSFNSAPDYGNPADANSDNIYEVSIRITDEHVASRLLSLRIQVKEDTDGDGVANDSDNCPSNANANQADLDQDSLGDACDDDIDGDGLSNDQEVSLGTLPANADSDGDGLTDGVEVNTHGTNPLESDTDHDGYSDKDELDADTSPTDANDMPRRSKAWRAVIPFILNQ